MACPYCNSENIHKSGRRIVHGEKREQRHQCMNCKKTFLTDESLAIVELPRLKKNPGVSCPKCNSENIHKSGHRPSDGKKIRRYQCKDCKITFLAALQPKKDPEKVVRNWPGKLFRVPPELQEPLSAETESFQKMIERILREKYNV